MTTRLDLTESVEMREYLVMNDEDYWYWNAEIKADVSCSSEEIPQPRRHSPPQLGLGHPRPLP